MLGICCIRFKHGVIRWHTLAYAGIRRSRKLLLGMFKNCVHIPTYGLYAKRKFKRKLDRCHKIAKRMSDVNSWAEFRRLRNEYIQNCRDAEKKYESSRLDKLNNSSFTTKECWSLYKSVLGLNTDNTYPSLIYNDRVIDNDTAKAMAFNDIFAEHSTVDDSHKQLSELSEADIGITTIRDIDITVADVTGQLLCLDILKA